jgi:hypothetical protein
VIAALEADELNRVGVAAFHPALHDAGRPAPQARRPAMAELTSRRKCRKTLVVITRRRATAIARAAQPGKGTRTVSRPHAGDVVGVSRAHPSYPQAGSSDHLPGSGAARPAQSHTMSPSGNSARGRRPCSEGLALARPGESRPDAQGARRDRNSPRTPVRRHLVKLPGPLCPYRPSCSPQIATQPGSRGSPLAACAVRGT